MKTRFVFKNIIPSIGSRETKKKNLQKNHIFVSDFINITLRFEIRIFFYLIKIVRDGPRRRVGQHHCHVVL